jgi:hypothetical protein
MSDTLRDRPPPGRDRAKEVSRMFAIAIFMNMRSANSYLPRHHLAPLFFGRDEPQRTGLRSNSRYSNCLLARLYVFKKIPVQRKRA